MFIHRTHSPDSAVEEERAAERAAVGKDNRSRLAEERERVGRNVVGRESHRRAICF